LEAPDGDEGQRGGDADKDHGFPVVSNLHITEDRQGEGLRAAGYVACHDDRRAELAESPAEPEDRRGQEPRPGERQRDAEEGTPGTESESAGQRLQARIDPLERQT